VIITQGSMKITGNTVTITRAADRRHRRGDLGGQPGLLRAANPGRHQAQDERLGRDHPVPRRAKPRRPDRPAKVDKDNNTTQGEKIVYDTVKKVASAGRGNKVTAPRPRIDMVIQPKKKAQ
jgi:lipopolysaccharide export system protein LptA